MKNLRRQVSDTLVERGYSRDGRMHLLRLTDELSWVVDTGPLGKEGDISPFVGIRHDALEQLVFRLLDLPLDPSVASVGANVGYIVDDAFQTWSPHSKVSDVLAVIALAQEKLMPYLSLEKLPGVWALTRLRDPGMRYRQIAILLLLQDYLSIPETLETARSEFCRFEDAMCEQFRGFERRVRSMLPSS